MSDFDEWIRVCQIKKGKGTSQSATKFLLQKELNSMLKYPEIKIRGSPHEE